MPQLLGSSPEKVAMGAYVLQHVVHGNPSLACSDTPDLVIVATGSEVSLAIEAAILLTTKTVRIVSMPCWDLFDQAPLRYKEQVLLTNVPVLSVEAGATFGWCQYSHAQFGLDRFGASATIAQLKEHFGFDGKTVAEEAQKLLDFYAGRDVPSLFDVPPRRILSAGHH